MPGSKPLRDRVWMNRARAFVLHEYYPLRFLLITGLLVRGFILLGVDGFMWPDSEGYVDGAGRILEHGIFTHQLIWRSPLYPACLAFFMQFGQTPAVGMALVVFQHLLGLASVLLVYKSVRMVFGPLPALLTAFLVNVHTLLLYYENVIQTELLFLFLLCLSVHQFLAALRSGRLWRWFPLGLLFGLLILARPIGQLLIPALFPVVWWKTGRFRRALACSLVAVASCHLVLAPWMVTNKRVYGFWGISHLSGVQLFHKAIDKAFMPFPPVSRHPEVDSVARTEKARQKRRDIRIDWQVWGRLLKEAHFTQLKADQEMFAYAVETIRADPVYFARDYAGDFVTFFWNAKRSIYVKYRDTGPHLSAPHGSRFGNAMFPSGAVERFPWVRERLSEFFRRLGLPIKALVVLSLIGAVVFFRKEKSLRAEGLIFAILPLYLAFFTTLFETYQDRYRLPADPFTFAFAMYAVSAVAGKIAGRPSAAPEDGGNPHPAAPPERDPDIPDISVVILCYRAQEFAPVFVAQVKELLEKNHLSFELVLVANYRLEDRDSDRTPEVVRGLARGDSRIKVIAKEKQGMMGWDMQSGLSAAEGRTVAIIDGDGQMPPEDILRVYRTLINDSCDMTKTYRSSRQDGPFRILISRVYNLLLRVLFPKVRVHDANSKPRIFRREALRKIRLTADDWFIDAEIVIQASYLGFKIGEVPTVFRANEYRVSFVKPTAIFEFIRNLVAYRLKHWRGFRQDD